MKKDDEKKDLNNELKENEESESKDKVFTKIQISEEINKIKKTKNETNKEFFQTSENTRFELR